ncbi:hypothetical protein [Brevibacillus sp. AY1]|uniref:hypothetical protein n=1 Tax=Brevibacillus sp. AY1 TaxID=2807621 RepID=UPI0024561D93|nr:hypothetical protein [Brevibacillus sp. AY1]MDH4615838.1 hypothetical protein [Brevibacillus sp. AY1]
MLASFYRQFEEWLHLEGIIENSDWRTYAGQRFFYVNSQLPAQSLTQQLLETGERLSIGTKLKPECIYVRSAEHWHVYRFRFRVPDEKQFCCGNLCENCFLLRLSPSSQTTTS